MKAQHSTRRHFLKQTATLALTASALPSFVPASALGKSGKVAPSNRIVVGCIGTGERGRGVMSGFLPQKDVQIVAVCDVKTDQLALAKGEVNKHYQNQDCATYGDFREVVSRKDIDAFLIATPDHWHVLTALAAVRAGKDVYVEKPMGLSLAEDWALRKEVHKHKRVFQFGTQQRSSRLFRIACELVRNGRIGKLKHINVWAPGSSPGGPNNVAPVPPELNYDMWLGPAPFKPHTQDLCSSDFAKKTWWFKSDYALGFIAGWGVHPLDIAAWGADLFTGPIEVEGRGTFYCEGACDTATVWNIDMKFASGVTMKFVGVPNGGNRGLATGDTWPQEKEWTQRYRRISSHGTSFEGTDGWVHIDRDGINLQPENLIDENPDTFKVKLTKSPDHVRNFLDCIKTRSETVCPIDEAVRSDTLCHIAEIAIRLNRRVVWDPKKERFIGDEEANLRLLGRKMRSPWHL
ncbi:MAG TPA: Gfo/Idh/MocA family oxidoreductase [Clostridia bacterium]|nr:Gfo/Idh/MocA family oxidoreductase [Clostridia bacterium]